MIEIEAPDSIQLEVGIVPEETNLAGVDIYGIALQFEGLDHTITYKKIDQTRKPYDPDSWILDEVLRWQDGKTAVDSSLSQLDQLLKTKRTSVHEIFVETLELLGQENMAHMKVIRQ